MSEVQFTEEEYTRRPQYTQAVSGLTKLVIAWGFAKDEKQAQRVLLIIAGIAIVIAIAVPIFFGGSSEPSVPRSVIDAGLPLEVRGR